MGISFRKLGMRSISRSIISKLSFYYVFLRKSKALSSKYKGSLLVVAAQNYFFIFSVGLLHVFGGYLM